MEYCVDTEWSGHILVEKTTVLGSKENYACPDHTELSAQA